MSKFVVDAWAWIEYFDGSKAGEKFKNYIEDEKNEILTCSVTLAEVISKFLRLYRDAHIALKGITTLSKIVIVDETLASFAGELHAESRAHIKDFGLADAFVLATAKQTGARILTGDKHFKSFREAIVVAHG